MPRFVRFPGLLLTAALVVTGCTSSPAPRAATAPVLTDAASPDAGTPSPADTPAVSPSSKPTRSARPTASPTVSSGKTPTATSTPTTTKPSATHSASPTDSPTTSGTPSPTTSPTKAPPVTADPIVAGAYAFPVAGCHVSYGSSHHDYPATDIFAARGCHFVAPIAGTVDEVSTVNRWSSSTNKGADRGGLSISIVGDDGVRYYGSHLTAIEGGIAPGVRVERGQLLGYVGDTGSARGTGTHLHFGLSWPTPAGYWWVRRGEVSPYKYLNAWRSGVGRSPSSAVAAAQAANGDDSVCHTYC